MANDQTFENYRKSTRRDEFLKTMEAIVPWAALCEVIEPHYPKVGIPDDRDRSFRRIVTDDSVLS